MKKLFPILVVLVLISTACQLGGQAQPTAIAVPTAAPTNTPIALNPTAAPSGNQAPGSTRQSVDGMTEVFIPAGAFQMGGFDSEAKDVEKPVHQVTMPSFWFDKFDVTNAMYVGCIAKGGCTPPQATKSQTRSAYFNIPDYNDFPVIYVTWSQAATYCKWAGRHLPTEAEWEYAARGKTVNTYPWGSQPPDSSLANFNYQVGDTTKVGSYPAGASPFGVLDMAGNVAQWTNDYFDPTFYTKGINNNPQGPGARTNFFNRVVRGGTFQDGPENIRVSLRASVLGSNPDAKVGSDAYFGEYSPKIGFRCASDQ